ncbi:type IV pilus modification PilV family protein [Ureibacillus manganicus]|uniref:Prepilin-type N-terminal cleavage/methylation domain-containing protein n=1 Tax=Ureibacillus manganicus DSM 26584 TaxID=1384049 RepID=A0A0A3IXV9_9BACL|nr:prepilin-type N-terminal cleavage/methylation domain-containing protein [Ureibacillus manganicus]KGR79652.1 hypothetical protein CD29_06020 [Ureibacillus manganicus DSM 26584]
MTLKKSIDHSSGISLLEVLVSIVILSLIFLSFFYLFIQSAKTTKSSETIIDSTYVAQSEMEQMYYLSSNIVLGQLVTGVESLDHCNDTNPANRPATKYCYHKISQTSGKTVFDKYDFETDQYIKLTLKQHTIATNSNFIRILIQVFEEKDGLLKAQMENTIEWSDGS